MPVNSIENKGYFLVILSMSYSHVEVEELFDWNSDGLSDLFESVSLRIDLALLNPAHVGAREARLKCKPIRGVSLRSSEFSNVIAKPF